MSSLLEIISYIGIGIYLTVIYNWLSMIEPFCFYLPGGISRYYKVHKNINIKFEDIVGDDEIKAELRAHIKYFQTYKLSKGFVFEGPSGTGKTLMARAIAGESNHPFIEIFSNNMQSGHIPTILKAVVKKHYPCIIFIDECNNIMSMFLETLLRTLDGIDSIGPIFLVLATNTTLDKSITRSGRIDKIVKFQLPSLQERKELFTKQGYTEERAEILALQTGDLTHADISSITREKELIRLYRKDIIDIEDHIINKLRFGRNNTSIILPNDFKHRTAYHEIGHLLLSVLLKDSSRPHKITVKTETAIVGHVSFYKDSSDLYLTKSQLLAIITVLLASSAFETFFLGEYSTLCSDDFVKIDAYFDILYDNYMLNFDDGKRVTKLTLISKLNAFIEQIINTHLEVISQLHNMLIKHETLFESQFIECIGSSNCNSVSLPLL